MKAISILQPWASLVATGLKTIETRSWSTNYRGQLAIHASKNMPRYAKDLCPGFAEAIGFVKYNGSWLYYLANGVGNFGAVIATCRLFDCVPVEELTLGRIGHESLYGDFTPGRYAWLLKDIRQLDKPVPVRGSLGLWNWKPGEVAE